MHVSQRHRPQTVMQSEIAAETADRSALLRGLIHGVCLSAAFWAVIGWVLSRLP